MSEATSESRECEKKRTSKTQETKREMGDCTVGGPPLPCDATEFTRQKHCCFTSALKTKQQMASHKMIKFHLVFSHYGSILFAHQKRLMSCAGLLKLQNTEKTVCSERATRKPLTKPEGRPTSRIYVFLCGPPTSLKPNFITD